MYDLATTMLAYRQVPRPVLEVEASPYLPGFPRSHMDHPLPEYEAATIVQKSPWLRNDLLDYLPLY